MKSSRQHDSSAKMMMNESFTQSTELDTEIRDTVVEISKEVFKRHCAKRLEISPLNILDGSYPFNRSEIHFSLDHLIGDCSMKVRSKCTNLTILLCITKLISEL